MDSPPTKPALSTSSSITLDAFPNLDHRPDPEASRPTLVHSPSDEKAQAHHDNDLSTFQLLMAHFGAALALFLATTDATIVSTSLPTITAELHASQSVYTWVGVSYMLTQTALQPMYGKLHDLLGRKTVMYTSILIFALGSVLCGSARTSSWLIGARAIAGVGGGGIVSSVWTVTAEIVTAEKRAKWSQALSITWSCSAIAGPLLGGLFSTSALSWRWAFYINLPICFLAAVILFWSLRHVHLPRSQETSWRVLAQRFDFVGLFLFIAGSSAVVVGFALAPEQGWTSPLTLCLCILGPLFLICGGFYEVKTTRDALFSPTTFSDSSAGIILVINFLHNLAFTAGTFYLALYFQAVGGRTPLQAGLQLLPYSLGSSLASIPAAWFIGAWQRRTGDTSGQKWIVFVGLVISAAGFGLLQLLDEHSRRVSQVFFPLIAGVGVGMLFHAPFQIFTRILKPEELASGTSAFFLVRFTGATIGLSVAGAIFDNRLTASLPLGIELGKAGSMLGWGNLTSIEPLALREDVLKAVAGAIGCIWTLCTPCLAFAALIACFLRVKRTQADSTSTDSGEPASSVSTVSDEKLEV